MSVSAAPTASAPQRARSAQWAVSALFFGFGLLFATLGLNIPGLREALGLSDTQVGFALLGVSVGSLISMPLTGRWVERWGSHRLTRAGALLTFSALLLPFFSTSLPTLILAFGVLGLFNGVLDVSLSAQGVTVEQAAGRPLMSRLHAFYSLGGLGGALLGGLLVGRVLPLQHITTVTVLILLLAAWGLPRLLPDAKPTPQTAGEAAAQQPTRAGLSQQPTRAGLSSRALMLGGLCFLGMLTEGANYDWAAIYYRDVLGVQAGKVAWGYGAFVGAMALGRWFGDRFRAWIGDLAAVRGGSLLAAAGLALALLWPHPVTSTLGFALSGLGLSNVVPVMYSVAGHALAGRGIATVATIGHAGFLLGPPAIGFLSDQVGLQLALAVAAAGAALVGLLAGQVFRQLRSS
ncbi:MFS transporter [Deinococcus sp. Marseille-Q6407]|uniref:MFS transporter n=1 Tax=Deinococcus sp. Marseille-Q6407 TaxID=2969223 RepID=UPI0021BEFB19|nr:MFS transporter [Deinococcus sp. Marseille-Q6407]